ncbi:MAG: hypothetical protein R3F61_33350 [Myxococcota bacterium]
MDDPARRTALLTALAVHGDRPNRLEPWEAWLGALHGEALADEASLVAELLPDRDHTSLYRRTVVHHADPRMTGPIRRVLVSLLVNAHLSPTTFHDTVRDLAAADDATFHDRITALSITARLPGLAQVHSVMRQCLRAVPTDRWPEGPFHKGEPAPDIGAAGFVALAGELAAHVEDPELRDRLLHAESVERRQTRSDMAGASLRPQAAAVAVALAERSPPALHAYLACMDDTLRRLDIVHALAKRKQAASSPVIRAAYRAGDPASVPAGPRATTLHIAELANGTYGLLCKLKGRYRWIEGTREEVLASVPEAQFTDAVRALSD